MKKVDKGDRGVAGGELEDGPTTSRVPPGKQLTDGERLNRTRDHLAPLSAQIQIQIQKQIQDSIDGGLFTTSKPSNRTLYHQALLFADSKQIQYKCTILRVEYNI